MIRQRTLRRVGGSVMVAVPPQMLRHLGSAGDAVTFVVVDGGLLLSRYTRREEVALNTLDRVRASAGQGIRRLARSADGSG